MALGPGSGTAEPVRNDRGSDEPARDPRGRDQARCPAVLAPRTIRETRDRRQSALAPQVQRTLRVRTGNSAAFAAPPPPVAGPSARHATASSGSTFGQVKVNAAPAPAEERSVTRPPRTSTAFLTSARPIPLASL